MYEVIFNLYSLLVQGHYFFRGYYSYFIQVVYKRGKNLSKE